MREKNNYEMIMKKKEKRKKSRMVSLHLSVGGQAKRIVSARMCDLIVSLHGADDFDGGAIHRQMHLRHRSTRKSSFLPRYSFNSNQFRSLIDRATHLSGD